MTYTDAQRSMIKQFIHYGQTIKNKSHMEMDKDNQSVHTFRATSLDFTGAGMEAVMKPKLFKDCEVLDGFITGGGMFFNDESSLKVRYEWKYQIKKVRRNGEIHELSHLLYFLYPAEGTNEFYFFTNPEDFEWDFKYVAIDDINYNIQPTNKKSVPKVNWDNYDVFTKTYINAPTNKPEPKMLECVICLDDCDATGGWECRTCNSGKVCKGCKAKCKGIKSCPVCRTEPQHKKRK